MSRRSHSVAVALSRANPLSDKELLASLGGGRWSPHQIEGALWALVMIALFGDLGVTIYGIEHGFSELNPLAVTLVESLGLSGFVLPKIGAVATGAVGRRLLQRSERWVVPLGLAVPWTVAVVLNCVVVTGA